MGDIQVLETQTKTVGQGLDRGVGVIGLFIAGIVAFVVVMGGLAGLIGFLVTRH